MKLTLLFAFLGLFASALTAQPIVYVTPTGAGTHSGASWANALPGIELPGRLSIASASTQFWLAAGIYKPTTTTDRTASFSIASGVSMYGGFVGTETTPEQRPGYSNLTFLSGDIGVIDDAEDNSEHVISLQDITGPVVIDGLTVSDGKSAGNSGAGIRLFQLIEQSGTLSIHKCRFTNNTIAGSLVGGGAISVVARNGGTVNLAVTDCFFAANQAESGGAFFSNAQGGFVTSTFENCLFTDNSGSFGGAVYADADKQPANLLRLDHCQFSNNQSLYVGGAIHVSGFCEIQNSVFNNNSVLNNVGLSGGGAVEEIHAEATYQNCIFSNNTAPYGGAILAGRKQTFTNCTFTQNSASISGGVFYNAPLQVSSVLIQPNQTYLRNCIVWQNTAPLEPVFTADVRSSPEGDPVKSTLAATYSLIQDGYLGTGNLNTDPLFVDPTNDNYRLNPTSPAVNTGDPEPANLPTIDFAGNPRIQGGRIDMGAYEFVGCPDVHCLPFTIQRQQ